MLPKTNYTPFRVASISFFKPATPRNIRFDLLLIRTAETNSAFHCCRVRLRAESPDEYCSIIATIRRGFKLKYFICTVRPLPTPRTLVAWNCIGVGATDTLWMFSSTLPGTRVCSATYITMDRMIPHPLRSCRPDKMVQPQSHRRLSLASTSSKALAPQEAVDFNCVGGKLNTPDH